MKERSAGYRERLNLTLGGTFAPLQNVNYYTCKRQGFVAAIERLSMRMAHLHVETTYGQLFLTLDIRLDHLNVGGIVLSDVALYSTSSH